MKEKLNYLKKFVKTLVWPILLTLGQFLLIVVFTLFFNLNYINNLKSEYPNFSNNEINIKFNEITNTDNYIQELSEFLNDNNIFIMLIMIVIFLPILIKIYKKLKDKNIEKIDKTDYLKIITFSIFLSLSLNIILYLINTLIPITNRYDNIKILFYTIIPTGIIGPILEEYIFRGIVYNKLKSFNSTKKAIILTTLIFSIMHFELSQIIYTLIIGYYLTYLYAKTNNIKVSIISHIVINTTTILLVPLILNTNIYVQFGLLILLVLSYFEFFDI